MDNNDPKNWAARAELGQVLERNLEGAYKAAMELLRMAGRGYSCNNLNDAGALMRIMSEMNSILGVLRTYIDEAKMLAQGGSKMLAQGGSKMLAQGGSKYGPVQQEQPSYTLLEAREVPRLTPVADFLYKNRG